MSKVPNPPAGQAQARVLFYIDGFNLYFGMKTKGWNRYLWLDLQTLCGSLCKPDQKLAQVKYFTARVSSTTSDPGKSKRQSAYLDAIEAHGGVLTFYGKYLSKDTTCKNCGAITPKHEEKETDVNIAVAVLGDAFTDQFDTAILISADSDLVPVVRAVRHFTPHKRVVIAFPPARQSYELRQAANGFFHIGETDLRHNQPPNAVTTASGYVIHRPVEWQ